MNRTFRQSSEKEELLKSLLELPVSELTSVLLAYYAEKTGNKSAARLLEDFCNNRFVKPATLNAIDMISLELDALNIGKSLDFEPVILSPVAPLGTSSSMAPLHQNLVLSALRGVEVVSDATNVLALLMADRFKKGRTELQRCCTVHRHLRCQWFDHPLYTAHFGVFCLVSMGPDTGNYQFEIREISWHIKALIALLKMLGFSNLEIRFSLRKGHILPVAQLKEQIRSDLPTIPFDFTEDLQINYYEKLRFKIWETSGAEPLDFADGGLVDWSRKILSNEKQRMCISGVGLDLLLRRKGKL